MVWVQFSTELTVSRQRIIEPFIITVTCSRVMWDFPCANVGMSRCSWIVLEAMQKSSVTYPSGEVPTLFLSLKWRHLHPPAELGGNIWRWLHVKDASVHRREDSQ